MWSRVLGLISFDCSDQPANNFEIIYNLFQASYLEKVGTVLSNTKADLHVHMVQAFIDF